MNTAPTKAPYPEQRRGLSAAERVSAIAAIAMLTVLGAVMAIIGGFQVPTMPHVLGIGVPVGVLIAVVGNLSVGIGGAIGTGQRLGAVGPAVGWLIMTLFVLGQTQSSGSLIIPGSGNGQAFLFAGVAASVAAITIGPLRWVGTGGSEAGWLSGGRRQVGQSSDTGQSSDSGRQGVEP